MNMKTYNFSMGIIFIILGISLIFSPINAILFYSIFLGLACLIFTLCIFCWLYFVKKNRYLSYSSFVFSILLSLGITLLPIIGLGLILFIIIFIVLLSSIIYLFLVFVEHKEMFITNIVVAVLLAVSSIFLLFNIGTITSVIGIILGILLILNGFSYLIVKKTNNNDIDENMLVIKREIHKIHHFNNNDLKNIKHINSIKNNVDK